MPANILWRTDGAHLPLLLNADHSESVRSTMRCIEQVVLLYAVLSVSCHLYSLCICVSHYHSKWRSSSNHWVWNGYITDESTGKAHQRNRDWSVRIGDKSRPTKDSEGFSAELDTSYMILNIIIILFFLCFPFYFFLLFQMCQTFKTKKIMNFFSNFSFLFNFSSLFFQLFWWNFLEKFQHE